MLKKKKKHKKAWPINFTFQLGDSWGSLLCCLAKKHANFGTYSFCLQNRSWPMVVILSRTAERLISLSFWYKQTMEKKPVLGTAHYMLRLCIRTKGMIWELSEV